MQNAVYCRFYSGTYCDNYDVTDHDIEDCHELITESLSPDMYNINKLIDYFMFNIRM